MCELHARGAGVKNQANLQLIGDLEDHEGAHKKSCARSFSDRFSAEKHDTLAAPVT